MWKLFYIVLLISHLVLTKKTEEFFSESEEISSNHEKLMLTLGTLSKELRNMRNEMGSIKEMLFNITEKLQEAPQTKYELNIDYCESKSEVKMPKREQDPEEPVFLSSMLANNDVYIKFLSNDDSTLYASIYGIIFDPPYQNDRVFISNNAAENMHFGKTWHFEPSGDELKTYYIRNIHTNEYLYATDETSDIGRFIRLSDADPTKDIGFKWIIERQEKPPHAFVFFWTSAKYPTEHVHFGCLLKSGRNSLCSHSRAVNYWNVKKVYNEDIFE